MTDEIYTAIKLNLVYTYPSDPTNPEKEYQVGGFAAATVLARCTATSLIQMSREFDLMRFAFQREIGRRQEAEEVDPVIARYAETERAYAYSVLDSRQVRKAGEIRAGRVPAVVPDFDLLDEED